MVGQDGVVHLASEQASPGPIPILIDIGSQVLRGGNEEGLLGLEFDRGYESNGHFYLYYSAPDPRRSVLSRFTVEDPPLGEADPASERVLLEIPEPFSNHNGGMIELGPDGYLYIGVGDGGSGGDPMENGQNPHTLLGTILRIDVSPASVGEPYAIPQDNPFADGVNGRPEVWAYGLRNPWRFSFDPETGDLWVGDVGQNRREEVDIVTRGGNYGWNIVEGNRCFGNPNCDPTGLEPPVIDYDHSLGCSVTGGYVYRGSAIPELTGAYVYADFCSGRIWALRYEGGEVMSHRQVARSRFGVSSFGEIADGELYVTTFGGGVLRLVAE